MVWPQNVIHFGYELKHSQHDWDMLRANRSISTDLIDVSVEKGLHFKMKFVKTRSAYNMHKSTAFRVSCKMLIFKNKSDDWPFMLEFSIDVLPLDRCYKSYSYIDYLC